MKLWAPISTLSSGSVLACRSRSWTPSPTPGPSRRLPRRFAATMSSISEGEPVGTTSIFFEAACGLGLARTHSACVAEASASIKIDQKPHSERKRSAWRCALNQKQVRRHLNVAYTYACWVAAIGGVVFCHNDLRICRPCNRIPPPPRPTRRLHFFFPDSRLALDLNTDRTLKEARFDRHFVRDLSWSRHQLEELAERRWERPDVAQD